MGTCMNNKYTHAHYKYTHILRHHTCQTYAYLHVCARIQAHTARLCCGLVCSLGIPGDQASEDIEQH